MTISPLRAEHVRQVAALHVQELTGLLRALGTPATRAWYAGCVASPRMIAFVALDGDTVRGFVCGSMTPRVLRYEAMALRPFATTAAVALGIAMHPTALPWVLALFRGPVGGYDADAPELTYLAVTPDQRRGGIGKQLVEAFTAAMRSAGARSCELSVDHDNPDAEAFYRRLGFTSIARYREFGVDHWRYRMDLTGAPSR